MTSEIESLRSENEFLKAEVLRLKNQIESDAYKVILDSSPDIIIQLDLSYKVLIIHIPSIPKERLQALVGKNIFDITPVYAHEKMVAALEDVYEQGKVVQYESDGITLGAYRYYDNYVAPIRNELDEIVSAYFVSKDITTQKKAEKILLESERKLKTVYENSIQILTILDLKGNFVWFNKNALDRSPAILGRLLVMGESAESYIEKSQRDLFISNFNRAINGENVIYTRNATVNKKSIYIEYTLSPIYEETEVVGVSLTGINVTKHKEYEDYLKRINLELVSQNEQLNHYSHIISHNLRGPVATLMGLVKLFEHEKNNSQQVEELMQLIYKSALNFDTIIKDLTEVISHEEQKGDLLTKINLKEECEVIEFLLSTQIHNASAQIIYNFGECHNFFSIKSYVHSILYNLISNGIKYKRTNVLPVLHISCYLENEKEFCIQCEDNGLGLDLDKYGNKLFGFYKRFHSHVEGKGLGLHLVKKQVDLLGGRVEVQSKINEGTIFKIFLPV
ncbi:ATP-binding protein [uncultured Cytophaga sp.]|uniref:sensor histidine kinase n=1 Tax=uncultured Cytophaga sp. TaxID=160238 RepID=UPI0026301491|nr:ATP-binding protein [uncultured Cytophaga sp.]